MPEITPERMRELAAAIVLDAARDIEYLSVGEMLEDEPELAEAPHAAARDDLTRQIHDLAKTAMLTVEWPADAESTEVEQLRAEVGRLRAQMCERCQATVPVGTCCSSHNKRLCHLCYRRTHFAEVCVEGCPHCAAEGLPVNLGDDAKAGV